ncbi:MAG: M56 family metallopeptidase [Bacteroidales bacterium]|nr:M56 family metallopeptidase [Bacteroidales bacterium]
MNAIISYFIESLFCGALLYLIFRLITIKEISYTFQRVYILFSLIAISIFPLISIPVELSSPFGINLNPIIIGADSPGLSSSDSTIFTLKMLKNAVWYLYISISALYLLFIIVHLVKIAAIYLDSVRVGFGKYTVVSSKRVEIPFSFMNNIFINNSTDEFDREYIIKHEFSHIYRRHSADILFVNFISIFLWFNPIIYLFKKLLIETHEFQADRDVLKGGGSINHYRNLLLNSQFGASPYLSSSLNKSLTLKRFKKMENLEQKRAGFFAVSASLLTLTLLFTFVAFNKADGNTITSNDSQVAGSVTQQSIELADTTKYELPFMKVEVKPVFMGGDENTFTRWVAERLVYPPEAKASTIQGRVILQFLIDKKGNVKNVKVLRGVHKLLDEEAVRVVSLSPPWTPGKEKGENVSVVYVFPVIFQLR